MARFARDNLGNFDEMHGAFSFRYAQKEGGSDGVAAAKAATYRATSARDKKQKAPDVQCSSRRLKLSKNLR
jgi:hypothetical protein